VLFCFAGIRDFSCFKLVFSCTPHQRTKTHGLSPTRKLWAGLSPTRDFFYKKGRIIGNAKISKSVGRIIGNVKFTKSAGRISANAKIIKSPSRITDFLKVIKSASPTRIIDVLKVIKKRGPDQDYRFFLKL